MDGEEEDTEAEEVFYLRAKDVFNHPRAEGGFLRVFISKALFRQIGVLTDGVFDLHYITMTLRHPTSVFSGLRSVWVERDPHGFGGFMYVGYGGPAVPQPPNGWPPEGKIFELAINVNLEITTYRLKDRHETKPGCPKGYETDFSGRSWFLGDENGEQRNTA